MKKDEKKNSKKEKEEQEERQRLEREQQEEAQRLANEKEGLLAQRSSPLIEFGLLDAFEFFMVQLTQAGIPQGNVYEFAAQMMLKYEKNLKKKIKNVSEVNEYNSRIIKELPSKSPPKPPRQKVNKKAPNVMPFKSQLTEEEKAILRGEKPGKNDETQQNQENYEGENFQNEQS